MRLKNIANQPFCVPTKGHIDVTNAHTTYPVGWLVIRKSIEKMSYYANPMFTLES